MVGNINIYDTCMIKILPGWESSDTTDGILPFPRSCSCMVCDFLGTCYEEVNSARWGANARWLQLGPGWGCQSVKHGAEEWCLDTDACARERF